MSAPVRATIVASHPIQYQVPWYRALAARPEVDLQVLFLRLLTPEEQGVGFDVAFEWDIPMLEGYRWEVAPEEARSTGAPGLRAVLADARPEVVVSTGWHTRALLRIATLCRDLGIPCCVRGESSALASRPWWKSLGLRLLLRRYGAFLVIGHANRDFYLGHGVSPSLLFDCPYFVDNERFAAQARELAPDRERIRAEWGVEPGVPCFVYAGKLTPKKRVPDLLEALGRAVERGTRLHLLVVGSGPLLGKAREFARDRGLPVTFAGFLNQSEIARAYVAGDCLVLPSDAGETWGLVVNEAMACGRPAVVSDRVGCGPDLVEDGVTGATFPCGDPAALAAVLERLASDRDGLEQLGRNARDRVLLDYSVERAVEGSVAAIRFLAGRTVIAERTATA